MRISREETTVSGQDHLDQLPDAIVLEIFNRVLDAKTLVRSLTVSKRFQTLIPQIDTIQLALPRQKPVAAAAKPARILKSLVRFLHSVVLNKARSETRRKNLYHSPAQILRGFGELRNLHLEIPSCKTDVGLIGKDSVLKWKAEFGANLKSCVILGANSLRREGTEQKDVGEKRNDDQSGLNDEELKTRIVWMISSLIAASARHFLTKRVVSEFPTLSKVVVSDADRRGRMSIAGKEIGELRKSPEADVAEAEATGERSLIPDLGMNLWHVPRISLSDGWVMEGATLVVIRPLDRKGSDGGDLGILNADGFDGDEEEIRILGEALREITKMKKTYAMEMTSF